MTAVIYTMCSHVKRYVVIGQTITHTTDLAKASRVHPDTARKVAIALGYAYKVLDGSIDHRIATQ